MNLPTIITLFRIALIPLVILVFYLPFPGNHLIAAAIFSLACITDWLDGYLARKWNQISKFGAFLDPVADKLMVVVALVMIVGNPHLLYIAVPAAIIIGRELVISALREWMAEIGKRASVSVSYIGKVKTTFQMLAIIGLLACDPSHPGILMFAGYVLLYIAALLTLWTMIVYLKAAWPNFDFNK